MALNKLVLLVLLPTLAFSSRNPPSPFPSHKKGLFPIPQGIYGGSPGVSNKVSKYIGRIDDQTPFHEEDITPVTQITSCFGNLNTTSGSITISNVTPGETCIWAISPPRQLIRVNLTRSSLRLRDALSILYFGDGEAIPITQVGQAYILHTDFLYITLIASSDNSSRSFSLDIYSSGRETDFTLSGFAALTATSGNFSYPVGGGNYANNEEALFIIKPQGKQNTTLTFTAFDLESYYDRLHIASFKDNAFDLLTTFEGQGIPPPITIPNIAMLVFTSDPYYTHAGFSFNYQ